MLYPRSLKKIGGTHKTLFKKARTPAAPLFLILSRKLTLKKATFDGKTVLTTLVSIILLSLSLCWENEWEWMPRMTRECVNSGSNT